MCGFKFNIFLAIEIPVLFYCILFLSLEWFFQYPNAKTDLLFWKFLSQVSVV